MPLIRRASGRLSAFHRPPSAVRRSLSKHSSSNLIEFDRFEQRLEVAFAETFVAFALDDLEEDRSDHVLREDLQQKAFALLGIAVDEDASLAQLFDLLAMTRHTRIDPFVVSIRRVL